MTAAEAGDGWRWYSPCAGNCGARVVTIAEYIGKGFCVDCGRQAFNADVPQRPVPGANNHLPMGQHGRPLPGRLDLDRLNRAPRRKGGR